MQKKNDFKGSLSENNKVVMLNLIQHLQRGLLSLRNNVRGRSRIKYGMTSSFYNNVNAFTLIELLVVVLIIGILAAVALPQYQKVVYKSRYATMKSLLRSVANAQEIYYLANGAYAKKFDELSVDLPAGGSPFSYGNDAYSYPWGFCSISIAQGEQVIFCQNSQINMRMQIYLEHSPALPGKVYCITLYDDYANPIQNEVCKSETGKTAFYSQSANNYRTWEY